MKWGNTAPIGGQNTIQETFSVNSREAIIFNFDTEIKNEDRFRVAYYARYFSPSLNDWIHWKDVTNKGLEILPADRQAENLQTELRTIVLGKTLEQSPSISAQKLQPETANVIWNHGYKAIKPRIRFKNRYSGRVVRVHSLTTNETVEFKNLQVNEEIFIDCESEQVISSLESIGIYRYDDHNEGYLTLEVGANYISFNGDFDVEIEYQEVFLQD